MACIQFRCRFGSAQTRARFRRARQRLRGVAYTGGRDGTSSPPPIPSKWAKASAQRLRQLSLPSLARVGPRAT
eukprot:scaffold133291_cov68-Phaeocystis_antarctica.AAC.4